MSYEHTQVNVPRSQEKIHRQLILRHQGSGVAFVSQPPVEGFHAMMPIEGKTYTIRIQASCRDAKNDEKRGQEERRIWRVLYHHLKAIFEAADSGVMEFRELMLPYIVVADGKTIAEHILPQLDKALSGKPERLLPSRT